MSFKKKVLAALLTIALAVAFCGQAYAAELPNGGIVFADGTVVEFSGDNQAQLVMLDGELLPTLAYADGSSIYLSARAIIEALGGTYTVSNGSVQTLGMNIGATALPSVISINGLFFDLGAEIKLIGGEVCLPVPAAGLKLQGTVLEIGAAKYQLPASVEQVLNNIYAPSGGEILLSVKSVTVSPVDLPIVLIETRAASSATLTANPLGYRDIVVEKMRAVNNVTWAQNIVNNGIFEGATMTDLIGAKGAVSKAVSTASLVEDLTYYFVFDAGSFSVIVNKYTGDFVFAGEGVIMTFETGNLTQLVK